MNFKPMFRGWSNCQLPLKIYFKRRLRPPLTINFRGGLTQKLFLKADFVIAVSTLKGGTDD